MKYFETIKSRGWVKLPNLIDENLLQELRTGIDDAYLFCRGIQINNGLETNTDGTVHHLPAVGNPVFIKLLNELTTEKVQNFLTRYFEGKYILNSYGGVLNMKNNPSYVANIHRDIRFFTDDINFMINVLVMLDDFTVKNGATYLLSESHCKNSKPDEAEFYGNAERAIGSAGDVLFFNSKLWHAAGINHSDQTRRAITISFTKPFFKQQLDYCRALGNSATDQLSEDLRQIIGYKSRTPENLYEWYQPRETRFYQPDQDISLPIHKTS